MGWKYTRWCGGRHGRDCTDARPLWIWSRGKPTQLWWVNGENWHWLLSLAEIYISTHINCTTCNILSRQAWQVCCGQYQWHQAAWQGLGGNRWVWIAYIFEFCLSNLLFSCSWKGKKLEQERHCSQRKEGWHQGFRPVKKHLKTILWLRRLLLIWRGKSLNIGFI